MTHEALAAAWSALGYSKFSDMRHTMEWAVLETAVLEDVEVRYVSTSYTDYPSLPEDASHAALVLRAAQAARAVLADFPHPVSHASESRRAFFARAADELEAYLVRTIGGPEAASNASIAADRFLSLAVDSFWGDDWPTE